jgi:pimeloyl-ACP methyl ester carboxylesterase
MTPLVMIHGLPGSTGYFAPRYLLGHGVGGAVMTLAASMALEDPAAFRGIAGEIVRG